MGLAMDIPYDLNASGGEASVTGPIIHQKLLTGDELMARYRVYQGSGGKLAWSVGENYSRAFRISIKKTVNSESTFDKIVEKISVTFNLTKNELADVCQVRTRKTLYNWIDGSSKPHKSTMKRIYELFDIAQAWRQSSYPNTAESIHSPVVDGRSVFDLLQEDKLDKERVLFAGTRLALANETQPKLEDPFA